MDTDRPPARRISSRRALLIGPVLVLATLVSSIISSFGAPLIPTVARELQLPLSTAQWSLTVALLAGAVASPILGRLGDGPRRRATLLAGLAAVTVGGVLAALSGGLGLLLVGRALQGVGLGLAPLAMATARDALPQPKVPQMIALLSVSAGAGLGAGYPVSGWIAGAWGLAGAYWFGAVVSCLALICVAIVIPPSTARRAAGRFDWLGVALLALALAATLVAISEGATWGWGTPAIVGLSVAGVALFAVWVVQQLRAEKPLVQLRLLRHPSVLAGVLGIGLGITFAAIPGVIAQAIPAWEIGRAMGFYQVVRFTGFCLGSALTATVLAPTAAPAGPASRATPRCSGSRPGSASPLRGWPGRCTPGMRGPPPGSSCRPPTSGFSSRRTTTTSWTRRERMRGRFRAGA